MPDLAPYRAKRDFRRTPEPADLVASQPGRRFVVQLHRARRLHHDFRLELDGVLVSWAVPRGPSLDPHDPRLAVHVEDHPLAYGEFEGLIPAGEYGAGPVILWDEGTWEPEGDARQGLTSGHLHFRLDGRRLHGRWSLVRTGAREGQEHWLLRKSDDAEARTPGDQLVASRVTSVRTRRTLDDVAEGRPARVPGAPDGELPGWLPPALATAVPTAPEGAEWLHEIKLDGYRALVRIAAGKVTVYTRTGLDWTARFAPLVSPLLTLPTQAALLDGEIVALDPGGRSDFATLVTALSAGTGGIHFFAFDLLHLDGQDLRGLPLLRRKEALAALLADAPPSVRYTDHVLGKGPVFFQAVCAQGLEGVVSKRADCPWRSGRGKTWRKVRCGQRQELVVVGWTDPAGARSAFGALLLGYWEGDTLRYAGRVGTGFDEATLASLKARLDPLARADCPLAAVPEDARRAHWVEPRLVAEVSFTEWTPDNRLRHPVFHGLREDKPATEVVREAPVPIPAEPRPGAPVRVAGVALTHPERVYWPDVGVTKLDLARYLERVADRMLPHVAGRPLTLVRCTEGLGRPCFHQRHHGAGLPEGVGRVVVPGHGGGEAYVWIADRAGLVGLAQVGVLEIHPWGVRVERPDHPDRLVFDLDPGPGLAWPQLVEAAEYVRNRLTTIGLQGFVRLTGSKGLHVVVPLVPSAPWAAVQPFCRAVAEGIARAWPERFTARMAPERRPGKIYLDYLRNTPTSTAVASWSPRALPGAPIALPVTWEALAAMGGSDRAGLRQIAAEPPPDPWPDLDAIDQRVDVETLRRAGLG